MGLKGEMEIGGWVLLEGRLQFRTKLIMLAGWIYFFLKNFVVSAGGGLFRRRPIPASSTL